MSKEEYVLISAAYNEGEHIGATIEAVLGQTLLPRKWIIISDGSTDNTDSIIKHFALKHSFIECLRTEKETNLPGFVSKVQAIRHGYKFMRESQYNFIGILDADITFANDYYERIINRFRENEKLGIAGGFIYEFQRNEFRSRPSNSIKSVAGAIQLFRRDCYEMIGGHIPISHGGEDWVCEILARKNGWEVTAFPEIVAYHQKQGKLKRGVFKDAIRQGKMDYAVGSHPLFELAKSIRRIRERPFCLRALFRLYGFVWSLLACDRVEVSGDIVEYLRREQLSRLRMLLRRQTR